MPTKDVPRSDWSRFLDGFSRRHEGWLVTLRVLSDFGAQVEAEGLPLEGIGLARPDGDAISVALGDSPDDRVEHVVQAPTHVRVEEIGSAEVALEIESEEGEKTLLQFRAAAPTETVNGVPSRR